MLVLCLVLSPVALIGILAWHTYNRLMALDERCNTAFADIDVQLKQRHSLIPGVVDIVRAIAGHELSILREISRARAEALQTEEPQRRLEVEAQVGQSLGSLFCLVERYPKIQASAHFRELRRELGDAENRIAAARRFYNLAVDELNATLRQFPGNRIGAAVRLARRRPFDLGIERILLDEPVTIHL